MTVLIVEDDDLTRKRLRKILERSGRRVIACSEGGKALEAFTAAAPQPEVVLTDWMMPAVDGLTLAKSIRRLTTGGLYTYVILLTSKGDTADRVLGFEEGGVDDYVVKPFSMEELLARVAVGERLASLERAQREYSRSLESVVSRQTRQIRETQEEVVVRLASALRSRDEETGAHVRRIGLTSALLAEALGWSRGAVDDLRVAAAMHDIGKVGIPDAILRKPGRLAPDELQVMRRHAAIGADILNHSPLPLLRMAKDIALGHHERWDGQGYPSGAAGEAIPACARIVAVADVFDAVSNDRVYRPALPEAEVLRLMREGRGGHFDPAVLDAFLGALPEMRRIQAENR